MRDMTFLLNLLGFFVVFGMICFILIGIFIVDYIRNKFFRRNKNIYKYMNRRR